MQNSHNSLVSFLGESLVQRGWTVTCAESCTGGGVAHALTSIAGSSQWFEYGFVTYADKAKTDLLGVDPQVLSREGAVSEAVVLAMAEGARARADANIAVAISGIAGPQGGSRDKPVGTVWIAWAGPQGAYARRYQFSGDRASVREQSVGIALKGLAQLMGYKNTI